MHVNLDFWSVVYHGVFGNGKGPFMALGYRVEGIAYISDVSGFPSESLRALEGIQVLIIDALHPKGSYSSHFCFDRDVIDIVNILKPSIVYLTGLSHQWNHHTVNEQVFSQYESQLPENTHLFLAYDGLALSFNASTNDK